MNGDGGGARNRHPRDPSWTAKRESAAVAADSQALSTMVWNRCPLWVEYAARDNARTAASGLRDIAGRLKEGRLTDADKSALNVVEQRFGKNFTDERGLGKLAKGLEGAANRIGERGEGAVLRQGKEDGNYAALVIPFTNSIRLGGSYFGATDSYRKATLLHEASRLNRKIW